jgi:hypothetical protein
VTMEVRLASEPAPGRVNEDIAFAVERADGASPRPARSSSLVGLLAAAIESLRADHAGRCDLDNPSTPAATVTLLRAGGDHADDGVRPRYKRHDDATAVVCLFDPAQPG